jgi:hypothetical protein
MSRTLHFGRDILDAPDIDVEELLGLLSPKDIQSLVDEMAADPDDKHLPASVRTAYRFQPTLNFDGESNPPIFCYVHIRRR